MPERNFACLTAIAYIASAAGLRFLPEPAARYGLVAIYGVTTVLAALVIAAALAFPIRLGGGKGGAARPVPSTRAPALYAALAMLALFFAMGGVWPYLGQIGQLFGSSPERTAAVLAAGALGSWLASLVAILLGGRAGRLAPVALGGVGMACSLAWLLLARNAAFGPAAVLFCFALNLAVPYLMAAVSALDRSGRLIAFAIAIQDVALAAGPLVAAILIPWGGLPAVLWTGIVGGLLTPVLLAASLRIAAKQPSAHM